MRATCFRGVGAEMWTYTAYIIGKYLKKRPEKGNEFKFSEFADFIFGVLWRKHKIVFHDGREDLRLDIGYLKKMGILDFEEEKEYDKLRFKVKDEKKLDEVVKVVENSPQLTGVDLLNSYLQRINKAVEEGVAVVSK